MVEKLRRTAFALLCLMPLLIAATRAGADIAGSLISALFLLVSFLQKDWRWTKATEMRVLEALWAFMMISAFCTAFSRSDAFMTSLLWGRFVLLYAAARYWLLTDRRSLDIAAKIAAVTLLLIAIDAGWQYVTGTSLSGHPMFTGTRLTGPLSKANVGGFLLKAGLPVAGLIIYPLAETGRTRAIGLCSIAIFGIATIILLSGERSSALLMLLAFAIVGLFFFMNRPRLRLAIALSAAGMAALVAILIATQPLVQMRAEYLVEQIRNFWPTPYGQMYISSFDLGVMHPLTGVGARQYLEACRAIMASHHITYCDIHPHNIYMDWLAAGGFVGLGLFILAMAYLGIQLVRRIDMQGSGIILTASAFGGYAALVFPFIVTQSVFANWAGVLFWYSMALVMSMHRRGLADG